MSEKDTFFHANEKKLGTRIFTVIGLMSDVEQNLRSAIQKLKPENVNNKRPFCIEWKERKHLFFWGQRKWRCTAKENKQGYVFIYLYGLKKDSENEIRDKESIRYIALKLKQYFMRGNMVLVEAEERTRKRPYKKPKGKVFDPFLRKMTVRTPQSMSRAEAKWERRESERKAEIQGKHFSIKRHREALRNKRLLIYEQRCRERERIWKEKGITEEFGRSKQWREARQKVIKEWHKVCAVCLVRIDGLIHIHHIHPKGEYPEKALEHENLVPVHSHCHARIHSSKPAVVHKREVAMRIVSDSGAEPSAFKEV
jgi:5-methylcytosine-specific restriction endonuclease McrA